MRIMTASRQSALEQSNAQLLQEVASDKPELACYALAPGPPAVVAISGKDGLSNLVVKVDLACN